MLKTTAINVKYGFYSTLISSHRSLVQLNGPKIELDYALRFLMSHIKVFGFVTYTKRDEIMSRLKVTLYWTVKEISGVRELITRKRKRNINFWWHNIMWHFVYCFLLVKWFEYHFFFTLSYLINRIYFINSTSYFHSIRNFHFKDLLLHSVTVTCNFMQQ